MFSAAHQSLPHWVPSASCTHLGTRAQGLAHASTVHCARIQSPGPRSLLPQGLKRLNILCLNDCGGIDGAWTRPQCRGTSSQRLLSVFCALQHASPVTAEEGAIASSLPLELTAKVETDLLMPEQLAGAVCSAQWGINKSPEVPGGRQKPAEQGIQLCKGGHRICLGS